MATTKKAAPRKPKTTRATREGKATCSACGVTWSITKFPTVHMGDAVYERDTRECRSCQGVRRAKKAAAKRASA